MQCHGRLELKQTLGSSSSQIDCTGRSQSISFEIDPIAVLSIRRYQSISIEIDCKTRYRSISVEIDRKGVLQSSSAPEPTHTLAVTGQPRQYLYTHPAAVG